MPHRPPQLYPPPVEKQSPSCSCDYPCEGCVAEEEYNCSAVDDHFARAMKWRNAARGRSHNSGVSQMTAKANMILRDISCIKSCVLSQEPYHERKTRQCYDPNAYETDWREVDVAW